MDQYADLYTKKIEATRNRLARVRKVLRYYPDARFVADYVDEVQQLVDVVEERLQDVLRLTKLEEEAGVALDNTQELYKSMRRIYGALLLYNVPDELRRSLFPRGLPKKTRIPVETLRVVGKQLVAERDGSLTKYKDIHPLIDEIRFHLEDSLSVAAAEVSVGSEAALAKTVLDQANANLDSAVSVMFHLAKADNVLNPGFYRKMYPIEGVPDEVPLESDLEGDGLEDDDPMTLEGSEEPDS